MKNLILVLFLQMSLNLFAQNNTLTASCCGESGNRCIGSAYCTACTSCSRCKYCKNGGTCGVCNPSNGNSNNDSNNSTSSNSKYKVDESIYVISKTLNLRSGHDSNSTTIEVLSKGEELQYLGSFGKWYKVRIVRNYKVGYVYSTYVQ